MNRLILVILSLVLAATSSAMAQQRRTSTTTVSGSSTDAKAAKPAPAANQNAQASQNGQARPVTNAPAVKSTTYDNWVMNCTTQTGQDNKPAKVCDIRSSMVIKDEKTNESSVAANIIIGRRMGEKTSQAMVQVPISALLLVQPRLLDSDNKPIAELSWVACQPTLCISSVMLTDAQVTALKKVGENLSVVYRNQVGQDIKIDGAAKGITAALDALGREK